MIVSFKGPGTEDVFRGEDTRAARKTCPIELWKIASRKLDAVNQAADLRDLRAPPNNRLEKLKGDRDGQWAIRINDQYRICFYWTEQGAEQVELTDYH